MIDFHELVLKRRTVKHVIYGSNTRTCVTRLDFTSEREVVRVSMVIGVRKASPLSAPISTHNGSAAVLSRV